MATPRITLTADRAARLFAPDKRASWLDRARPPALFAGFLFGHLALLGFLFAMIDPGADRAPEQEIAVEVVTEPPPEPPPPEPQAEPPRPEPEQQAQKPPEIEPATDAPRKAEQDRDEREARDDKAQAPQPAEAKEAGGGSQGQAEEQAAERKPDEPKPDAEVAARGEEVQKPTPQQAKGENKPAPPKPFFMQQLAALKPAPDYKLASVAKPAPVGGGDAKTTYLTILYGLIMPHMRVPPSSRPKVQGAVVIYIDTTGHVLHQGVVSPSGAPELDAAAMEAVRRAGPFPAPPKGLPPVRFTYAAP